MGGSNEDVRLIFSLFAAIGIEISPKKASFPNCVRKFLAMYFHLFSFYFLTVLAYGFYSDGQAGGQQLVGVTIFIMVVLLRVYFISRRRKIAEFWASFTNNLQLSIQESKNANSGMWIKSYFWFTIFLSLFVSFKEILIAENSKEMCDCYNYLFYAYNFTDPRLLVITSILEFSRNSLEISTTGLIMILLWVLFKELVTLMTMIKAKISSMVDRDLIGWRQVEEFSGTLRKTSEIVSRMNKEMSPFLFSIIFLYTLYIMALITIAADRNFGTTESVVNLFVVMNIILSLWLVGVLASKIREKFDEVKMLLLASDWLTREIFRGQSGAVTAVGLAQLMNELADSFDITVMGTVRINKNAMITLFCSFVSYGIILFQIFERK